jgi:hypothetical protein
MTDCPNKEKNLKKCNCTYSCAKKGMCCECVAYHRNMGEFPACFFSDKAEKTYDRSFEMLAKDRKR